MSQKPSDKLKPMQMRKTLVLFTKCFAVIVIAYMIYYVSNYSSCPQNPDLQLKQKGWTRLLKYEDSNAQLSKLPVGSNQVIFMGDSITEGMNFNTYFPNKPYVNRGISAQTTPQMLVRFRSDVINLHPNVVIILAGINDLVGVKEDDSVESIAGHIKSMSELAQAHRIKVILASVLPVCGDIAKRRLPSKILEMNAILKSYAAENGILYLDYFSAFVGNDGLLKSEFTHDCLHMNQAGYNIMAPLAEAIIQKVLAK